MPIPEQITFTSSVANGVTTVFPYTFKIVEEGDIAVELDGVIQTTGFTISGVGDDSGGNVTFSTAPTSGVTVLRYLDPPLQRVTDYQQHGDYSSETLDADLDRIWTVLQARSRDAARSIKVPINDDPDLVVELPVAADRAGKFVGFDGSGNAIAADALVGVPAEAPNIASDDGASGSLWTTVAGFITYMRSSLGASIVGFVQAGAGAVLRKIQDKLREQVSVKDYGAVCDGVTDDSTADAAAVSAVKALGGGVVHYPGKTLTGGAVQRGGMRFVDENFPSFKRQSRWAYRADMFAANGEGTSAFQALSINGTLIPSTLANFLATAVPDVVTFSGWGLRGSGGTNPLVCSNFGAWFENNTNIVWAQEVDVNNEGATQAEGSDLGGVGVAINTGSTYSPDTGIAIRRFTGAGTGPGFLRGALIAGARNVGIRIEAMDTTTYPSLSPAAPGTIQALQVTKSSDSNIRWILNESGGMSWGSGAAAADVTLSRTSVGVLTVGGAINDTVAWSTATPTPTAGSGSFTSASATVRYNQIGKRVFGVARVQITTNGTAAGNVTIPLPINARTTVPQTAAGRERGVSGKALAASINATTMNVFNYDNTYPGADGADIVVQFMYEAA